MRRKLITILLSFTFTGVLSAASLIKDGQALGRIYVPMEANRPVMLAVQELQTHLKTMTGVEMPLAWRSPEKTDAGIMLEVRPKDEWQGKESAQTFTIVEDDGTNSTVKITGNTGLAVLYGVYQYLSDQGIRWFEPGEIGTNIPVKSELAVKKREFTGSPSFIYRCMDFTGWHNMLFDFSNRQYYQEKIHYEYDLWLLRNRLMFDRSIHNGDYFDFNHMTSTFGHNLCRICKLDPKDLEKEPERFPLVTVNGKKERLAKNAQICFTNETNIRNAVDSAVEHFKKLEATRESRNADLDEACDVISMSLTDAGGICECENCNKVAGTDSLSKDRLVWSFMNRVAKELNQKVPGKKIMLFAPYYELTRPPADMEIEKNIVAIACRGLTWQNDAGNEKAYPLTRVYRENLEATQRAGAEMACYDYILWQDTPQPLNILDAARFYAENKFKRYHVEVMQRNEMIWPVLWSLAQFNWNSTQDPWQLLAEFCEQYYGLKNGQLVLNILKQNDYNSRKMQRIIYGGPADTSAILTDEIIAKYRSELETAEKQATELEKERLMRFKNSLEVQMRFAEIYRAYSRALNDRTPSAVAAFKKQVQAFSEFWSENKMIRFCSPVMYNMVQNFSKIDFSNLISKKRKIEKDMLLTELFAGSLVPEKINNLLVLPENWKFQLDVNDNGLEQGWQKTDFNDQTWPLISTWDSFEKQGYREIGGRFWYRLTFNAPVFPEDEKIILRIGSLDDDGEIYINGKLLFKQQDIWMWDKSFAIDVTGKLNAGQENVIAVRGYDSMGAGGIWRPCALYTEK